MKVAELFPAAILTVAGTVTADVLEFNRETTAPPDPAAEVSVIVPVEDCPPTIMSGLTDMLDSAAGGSVEAGGLTVISKLFVTLEHDPEIMTWVEVEVLPVVIANVVDVWPAGTVTLAGTFASVFELESETCTPVLPAAAVRVTVPVPD